MQLPRYFTTNTQNPNGPHHAFEIDSEPCPKCGGEVQEPNAVGLCHSTDQLIAWGMQERTATLPEWDIGDDGSEQCERCSGAY